jgi:predicted transcriptional regulator
MADGALTVELDEALSERLKLAAEAAGRRVDDYAAQLISQALDDRWSESLARLAEYDRTGEYVPAEEALDRFRNAVSERLRKKA